MAFLRRGLCSNKNPTPTIHNKAERDEAKRSRGIVTGNTIKVRVKEHQSEFKDAIGVLRRVEKIIVFAERPGQKNVVELTCGHKVFSSSSFQGYCDKCAK